MALRLLTPLHRGLHTGAMETPAPAEPAPPLTAPDRTLAGLVRYFLKLGSSGFGGPIALVGYVQRDLVETRGWFPRTTTGKDSRSRRRARSHEV
jgi:hypothetical protein